MPLDNTSLPKPMSVALPQQSPFTFRSCLKLSLFALIVGAILRISFIVAIPQAFNGSDTRSFTQASDDLWSRHVLGVQHKRRWLYPLLLIAPPAIPAIPPSESIPLVQHTLGLLTVVGIGWIVGNITRFRNILVPGVTTVMAIWPKMLWYEHEVVAECVFLAAFVLTVALAFPLGSLRNQKRLFWFLISAALVAAIKPHGRGIWFGSLVMAGLVTGNPFKWNWKCWGAIAFGILMIVSAGEKRQGNWLLLNSVLPLVDTEGPTYHEYRQTLKPIVMEARKNIDDYPWLQEKFKKPLGDSDPSVISPLWASLTADHEKYSKVCGALAKEAVIHHPFMVAKFTIMKAYLSFVNDHRFSEYMIPEKFWKKQNVEMESRWKGHPVDVQLFYRTDRAGYDQIAADGAKKRNFIQPFEMAVSHAIDFVDDHEDPVTHHRYMIIGWLGVVTLLGLVCIVVPSRMLSMGFIWLPASLCILTVHAVGDKSAQYVHPVEWAFIVCIFVTIDVCLTFAASRFSKSKPGAIASEELTPSSL